MNQTSLVIGNGSVFTLAPSNSDGSPMAQGTGGGLVLASSLTPAGSFVASGGALLGINSATNSTAPVSLGGVGGASISAVPEPPSGFLLVLGALGLFGVGTIKRKRFTP
jgi:hypothetical protein